MDGLRFKSRNNLHNIKMSDEAVSISNTVGRKCPETGRNNL